MCNILSFFRILFDQFLLKFQTKRFSFSSRHSDIYFSGHRSPAFPIPEENLRHRPAAIRCFCWFRRAAPQSFPPADIFPLSPPTHSASVRNQIPPLSAPWLKPEPAQTGFFSFPPSQDRFLKTSPLEFPGQN